MRFRNKINELLEQIFYSINVFILFHRFLFIHSNEAVYKILNGAFR